MGRTNDPTVWPFRIGIGFAMAITVMLLVKGWSEYSFVLFVLTPVFYGFFAALFYSQPEQKRGVIDGVFASALVPGAVAAVLMLAAGFEGLICILMAAPLIAIELLIGAAIGMALVYLVPKGRIRTFIIILVPLVYVSFVAVEGVRADDEHYTPVTTAIEIAAPPEVVWKHVVSFDELPEPKHWLFKTGIAYPLRARIVGEGVGAVRYCEFTTGPFVEPIEIWDAPRHLRFSVTDNPAPMREASPWGEIHPPHLDGFMESRQGEFRLTPLPDGGTRLEGTTWYRHGLGPAWYWTLWSDYIIHTIHERVLRHIRTLAESEAALAEEVAR